MKLMIMKFQMSWNTMMEGFRRHEGETGQNPMEMAKQQNEEIKRSIVEAIGGEENMEQRLEQLRLDNEAKERDLEEKKREIRDRKKFYQTNAPEHVQQQLPAVFEGDNQAEPRFVEL